MPRRDGTPSRAETRRLYGRRVPSRRPGQSSAFIAADVSGLLEFGLDLDGMAKELRAMQIDALAEVSTPILDEQRRRVPVKTGTLRGSIRMRRTKSQIRLEHSGGKAFYGRFVHDGTTTSSRLGRDRVRIQGNEFAADPAAEMLDTQLGQVGPLVTQKIARSLANRHR